jgi:hypothetical protein
MHIGRSGKRTSLTPNNSGMPKRAERLLDRAASAYASKLENALAVDGVPIYIWNNSKGQHACLCRSGNNDIGSFTAEQTFNDGDQFTATKNSSKRRFRLEVDRDADTSDNTNYFEDGDALPPKKKIRDDLLESKDIDGRSDIGKSSMPFEDVLDALENANSLLDATMINCPICLGSGRVDSWKLEGCQRIMLEFSGLYPVSLGTAERLDEEYPLFELRYNAKDVGIEWEIPFPASWYRILRFDLYSQERIIPNTDYILEYCMPDSTEYLEFTRDSLVALNGNNELSYGDLKIRLKATRGKNLIFTHFDIILAYNTPNKAQFPELDITYEEEFIDSNINVGIEISPKARVKEGSYIYDKKHNRVWKIDSFVSKTTTSGVKFGYTANCRALHSFEKIYTLFKL